MQIQRPDCYLMALAMMRCDKPLEERSCRAAVRTIVFASVSVSRAGRKLMSDESALVTLPRIRADFKVLDVDLFSVTYTRPFAYLHVNVTYLLRYHYSQYCILDIIA